LLLPTAFLRLMRAVLIRLLCHLKYSASVAAVRRAHTGIENASCQMARKSGLPGIAAWGCNPCTACFFREWS
jgi:hypothetical protein